MGAFRWNPLVGLVLWPFIAAAVVSAAQTQSGIPERQRILRVMALPTTPPVSGRNECAYYVLAANNQTYKSCAGSDWVLVDEVATSTPTATRTPTPTPTQT